MHSRRSFSSTFSLVLCSGLPATPEKCWVVCITLVGMSTRWPTGYGLESVVKWLRVSQSTINSRYNHESGKLNQRFKTQN